VLYSKLHDFSYIFIVTPEVLSVQDYFASLSHVASRHTIPRLGPEGVGYTEYNYLESCKKEIILMLPPM
jgi:hypothetical protein